MNKRRIALLAGLMTMGMLSFAAGNNADVLKTEEQRERSTFNINDRIRFDENRMEVNGNLHLNENNRLEMRVRNFTGIGSGSNTSRSSGKDTTDSTEVRLRLHTQTSVENMSVRTELKTNTYDGSGSKQLLRVQPTWHLFTGVEGLNSVVRAGLGMEHSGDAHGEDYMITTSFENFYTVNDYLALEGSIYYDYKFDGNGATDGQYHNVEIEAYVYANYPLYEGNDIKVEALLEGGVDPYGFGNRHFDDLNNVKNNENGDEYYVLYVEPSLKVTKMINDNNSTFLQAGYYRENNEETSSGDDTAFVRFGFTSKF